MDPITTFDPDPLVQSPKVAGLSSCNFNKFLNLNDFTMVMFYDPKVVECFQAAKDLAIAANCTQRPNHAYAAVDCSKNKEMCIASLAFTFPTFKVYNKNQAVTTVRDRPNYSHDEMRQQVEQAPKATMY